MENLISELESIQHDCAITDGCKDCPYVNEWGACKWKDILGNVPVDWKLIKLHKMIKE